MGLKEYFKKKYLEGKERITDDFEKAAEIRRKVRIERFRAREKQAIRYAKEREKIIIDRKLKAYKNPPKAPNFDFFGGSNGSNSSNFDPLGFGLNSSTPVKKTTMARRKKRRKKKR